jgi:hypothetical protein
MSTVKKSRVTLTDRFGHFLFSFSSSVGREGGTEFKSRKFICRSFILIIYIFVLARFFIFLSCILSLSTCVYVHFYIRYWSLGEERSSSFQTQTLTRPWLPSRREGMESISRRTEPNITNDLGLDVCWCNRLFHRHIPPVFLTIITDEVWSKFFQEIYQPNGKTQKKKWNKK